MPDTNESARHRAYKDTEKVLGFLWYQVGLVMIGGVGAILGAFLIPDGANTTTQAWYGTLGAIVGVLGLIGLTFVIAILTAPYRQRNEARKQAVELDATLREVRREIQEQSGYQLYKIPEILREVFLVVAGIVESRKGMALTNEQFLSVIVKILDIEDTSPLLSQNNFQNKRQVAHMTKVFRQRMGLKKRSTGRVNQVVKRVIGAMDSEAVGLSLIKNQDYLTLMTDLDKYRTHISGSRLNQSIDNYLLHLEGLYSLRLLILYGNPKEYLMFFPKEQRSFLEDLESIVSGQMRKELEVVNRPLERWLGGDTGK